MNEIRGARSGGTVAAPEATMEGKSWTTNLRDGNAEARRVHAKPWEPPT